MDDRNRRQIVILAALLAVLAGVVWWNLTGAPSAPQTSRTRAERPARSAAASEPVDTIRLDALAAARPEPSAGGRDPFRFRPVAPPPVERPALPGGPGGPDAGRGDVPPAEMGPPPIPLRFIGVVRLPSNGQLMAVLSDENGVYRGSEGDIIEGRYRIVRLRPESVELAHVDGRGHQVIRLAGS